MHVIIILCCLAPPSFSTATEPNQEVSDNGVTIYHLRPDKSGGRAYRLVYHVKVPIEVYWKFKTDFDNAFLVKNKYIKAHRFVSRKGNAVITEDKYANGPDSFFRWQTLVFPDAHRLEFKLLNPEQCGQKFHYGQIQIKAVNQGTQIVQTAYFNFWGVSLWAKYPWRGGMKDFLSYTARWEQKIVLQLKGQYTGKTGE